MHVKWWDKTVDSEAMLLGKVMYTSFTYKFDKEPSEGEWKLLVLRENKLYSISIDDVIVIDDEIESVH